MISYSRHWQKFLGIFLAILFVSFEHTALGVTLADLFGGGSLTAGNARFSHWELVSLDTTGGALPNFSLINVVPLINDLTNPGVQIQANGQLVTSGINALDMYLNFRVSALAGGKAFVGHSLNLTSVTFGDLTGRALISEEIAGFAGDLGSAVVISDNESGFSLPLSSGNFAPQQSVVTTVNVFLNGLTSTINLNSYTHRFSQTGPTFKPGDFDVDGDDDGRDFLIWQRGGSPTPLSVTDLNAWKANYGIPLTANLTTVPEPSGILLVVALICLLIATRLLPKSPK